MNQEKIGNLIKELRKKNNLTQKDLADKYGVTYQAVSKWENGKNIPDISLLRQISKDFNIDLSDILDGNYNKKKKNHYIIIIMLSLIIIVCFSIYLINKNKKGFNFKTISTTCNDFNVTGSIVFDKDIASIYISNIDYCGDKDKTIYKKIDCSLYENNNNISALVSNYKSENDVTLEEYLKDIKLKIDNYLKVCKNYSDDSLYLEINAIDNNDKTITYKIPLILNDNCK